MNLDAVTAELRPRGPWEAADLGVRMARRDAATIYRVWFTLTLPLLAVALLLIAFSPFHDWVSWAYWWLEPAIDAPILYIISRRLFGESTNAREALRAMPSLIARNWIFLLPIYRFHFARSVAMPLTQLEGLSGGRRRERAKVMNLTTLNHGIGVTAAYQHLALSLYLGIIMLAFAFIPEIYQESLGLTWFSDVLTQDDSRAASAWLLLCFYAAQTALQPWFVGAGFGLYINCRTILEAWDIEVGFRRMLQARASRLGAAAVMIVCVSCFVFEPSQAEVKPLESRWDAREVSEAEHRVLDSDALQEWQTVEKWVAINADEAVEEDDAADLSGLTSFFSAVGRFIAFVVEFGLWFLAAALLIAIVITSKRWLPYLQRTPREHKPKSRIVLAGVEVSADTLPEDIPATVLQLWQNGDRRRALSILYRGSVFRAVEKHGVRLPGSATEEACVDAIATQTNAAQADFFRQVVAAWVWCAYGSREPTDATVTTLCGEWALHYGAVKT